MTYSKSDTHCCGVVGLEGWRGLFDGFLEAIDLKRRWLLRWVDLGEWRASYIQFFFFLLQTWKVPFRIPFHELDTFTFPPFRCLRHYTLHSLSSFVHVLGRMLRRLLGNPL